MIHLDFLVEVVVVLRAVGGGDYGYGFLGLPLVVVEQGFDVVGFEERKKKKKKKKERGQQPYSSV